MHIFQPQSACFRQMLESKNIKKDPNVFNPYPANIFPENFVCFFMPAAKILEHFRLDFIVEENTMNPDQIAPLEAD